MPPVSVDAWPPAGFVPAPLIPDRWSLQAPYGSDFSSATVSVTENGVAQQVDILSNSGLDYGGEAIVWDMPDAIAPQPGQQVAYAVQVDNVVIDGQSQSFSYTTTSFDPSTTTESTPVPAAVGFLETSAQVDARARSITIDVACSMNVAQPVSVDYSTVDGSALAGTNYVSTSGVLTFEPGQSYGQIVVPILPGDAQNPGGTFSVIFSAPTDASVGPISSFAGHDRWCPFCAPPPTRSPGPQLQPADSNGSPDGETTFLTSPYLIGIVQPGETVQLLDASDTVVNVAQGDSGGGYSIQVPGPLSAGSYAFEVDVVDQYGDVSAPSAAQIISVVNPPAPPLVTMTNAFDKTNKKHQVTEVIVTFSGPLHSSEADSLPTYRLATPGKNGSYTAGNAGIIKLKKAVYTASNNAVALTPRKPFKLSKPVQVRIDGTPPSGLQDANGKYIDGADNGEPGSNAIAVLSRGGTTIAAVPLGTAGRSSFAIAAAVDALLDRDALDGSRRTWRRSPNSS